MFDFLKPKKASVKHTITLKHRNGEQISITVEGTNINHINYVEKRIKETFNIDTGQKEVDKVMDEVDKLFKGFDEKISKEFGDIFKRF